MAYELKDKKEALRVALQEALHNFARDDSDKGLIVHYTVSIEVVGSDGNTWLKHLSSDGISAWAELGMLISAQDDIRARMREYSSDDED